MPVYQRKMSTNLWWLEVCVVVIFCLACLIALAIWHFNRRFHKTRHNTTGLDDGERCSDYDYACTAQRVSFNANDPIRADFRAQRWAWMGSWIGANYFFSATQSTSSGFFTNSQGHGCYTCLLLWASCRACIKPANKVSSLSQQNTIKSDSHVFVNTRRRVDE